VLAVDADSGAFARTAREEYPIFSSRLPSFEYSVWECAAVRIFAHGLDTPSGLALSHDGERLFVAEHATGKIVAFEVASGAVLDVTATEFASIGGLAVSALSRYLYFVDRDTNTLNRMTPTGPCPTPYVGRASPAFAQAYEAAAADVGAFDLAPKRACTVDPVVPDAALFDQVHDDTGYASNDTDVQGAAGMDADAALLANRTDCAPDSELNFDALLLGGFYCHVCLPGTGGHDQGATCDPGGTCANVQWRGFTCDNHFVVDTAGGVVALFAADGSPLDPAEVVLRYGVTYRFTVKTQAKMAAYGGGGEGLALRGNGCGCAATGPLLITPTRSAVPDGSLRLCPAEGGCAGDGAGTIRLLMDKDGASDGPVEEGPWVVVGTVANKDVDGKTADASSGGGRLVAASFLVVLFAVSCILM